MRVWRIAHHRFALDRVGLGSARFGGRWNPIGVPALYGGASIAVCALEKLVHLGSGVLPPQVLVAVDLPAECAIFTPAPDQLPAGWDALPTSLAAQAFGGRWLREAGQLAMRVPSAIVPEEANIVINPAHPDFARVVLTAVRPFSFDQRLTR